MEYTPRKQVTPSKIGTMVRHNPYSSGGRGFMSRFKKQSEGNTSIQTTIPTFLNKSSPQRIISRTDRIVNNSTLGTPNHRIANNSTLGSPNNRIVNKSSLGTPNHRIANNSTLGSPNNRIVNKSSLGTPNNRISNNSTLGTHNNGQSNGKKYVSKKSTPPQGTQGIQGTKRPFKAVNGVSNSDDPYGVWVSDSEDFVSTNKTSGKEVYSLSSDSDLEIFQSKGRDKENAIFSSVRNDPMKVYPSKKKIVPRSRIVYESSPEKERESCENKKTKPRPSLYQYEFSPDKDKGGLESRKNVPSVKKPSILSLFDSDSENEDKHSKTVEKDIITPPKQPKFTFQSKKKNLDISRSKLVNDISPEKLEKAYGTKYVTAAEKENVPTKVKEPSTEVTQPHLLGFPNYGNTCYMNSVLQALFGLPPFVSDYQRLASQLSMPPTSLSHGLIQVLTSRAKCQTSGVKLALRTVKENLVRVDSSFSGFKMQDANEFLTRILDTTKDEIERCHMTTPSPDRVQEPGPVISISGQEPLDENVPLCGQNGRLCEDLNDVEAEGDMVNIPALASLSTPRGQGKIQVDQEDSNCTSNKISESSNARLPAPTQITTPSKKPEVSVPKNPIKDNFEFQLLESYRCLGCGEVEGRKQEYFGLYVNLPEEGGESIQDAITAYMGADQRELKCTKCGHNQSSVVTSVTRLPRILIVQLKRYEYKAELGESTKRSSRVQVNRWLSLDSHMPSDVASPSSWDPCASSQVTARTPKQATLTVRNLSSELNVCEANKDDDELPNLNSPVKASGETAVPVSAEKEEEELQEVMRRSMDDVGGTQEEDEIQQAIRLSLQDMGMNYSQENQAEGPDEDDGNSASQNKDEEAEHYKHAYRLISIVSHFGLTTSTGHYVADVYNCEEDTWQHYDDECVSKIPESVVFAEGRQKNGYIFFYIHKDLLQKIGSKSSLPQR